MNYKKECLEKFAKLPKSIRDLFGSEYKVKKIDEIKKEYGVDLYFLVVLVAIGELMTYDIDTYIEKKFNLSKEKVREITAKLNELIFEPAMFEIIEDEDLLDDLFLFLYDKTFSQHQEELDAQLESQEEDPEYLSNILPELLSSNIFYIFDSSDRIKEVINDLLIGLVEDNISKTRIENLIYSNEEELSDKEFFLGDKREKGTISNWIKDYVNTVGIDKYDDLGLSKFITDSKNAKLLDEEERDLLYKVLKTYLNIKFFPEPFANMKEEDWHIIPIDEEIAKKPVIQKVFEIEKMKENKKPIVKDNKKLAENLLIVYKDFEKGLKNIEQLAEELNTYKNNLDPFFIEIQKDIGAKNKEKLMADTLFLCKNKLLPIFIKDNSNLLIEFKKSLVLKFSESTIENIASRYDSVTTISLYLQFLFAKFDFTPKESGFFAMYLAKVFKRSGQEKYFPIVYGDINLERFVFREVIEEAGILKLK